MASRELGTLLEKVGASPQFLPWTEAITALERGAIDAIVTGFSGFYNFKLYDTAKYAFAVDFFSWAFLYGVSEKAFEELPAEYRDVLVKTGKEFHEYERTAWLVQEADLRAKTEAAGTTIYDMTAEDRATLLELAKPVWEEWAQHDEPSRKALDVVLAATK